MVYIWTYRNPPPALLEDICRKNVAFNLRHAASAPRVQVDSVVTEKLADGLYKVRAVVSNHGYLPTNLTDVAVQNGVAKTVQATIGGPGVEVLINPATIDLGHLAGRNERKYTWSPWGQQWSPVAKPVEWLIRTAGADAAVSVTAVSEKGGTHQVEVTL
jgi:hypothetical protein